MNSRRQVLSWIVLLGAAVGLTMCEGCDGPPPPAKTTAAPSGDGPPTSAPKFVPQKDGASKPGASAAKAISPAQEKPTDDESAKEAGAPGLTALDAATSGTSAFDDLTAFKMTPGLPWGRDRIAISTPLHRPEGSLVFAPRPSALIHDGERVVDARTGKDVSLFREPRERFTSLRALGPDGLVYAAAHPAEPAAAGQPALPARIEFIACNTGNVAFSVPVDQAAADATLRYLGFIDSRRLLTIYKTANRDRAAVLNLGNRGAVERQLQIAGFGDGELAVSPDGKRLAIGDGAGNIARFDLATGDLLPPLTLPPLPAAAKIPANWPQSMAFSPSGAELAAIYQNRIVCWNQSGEVTCDIPFPYPQLAGPGAQSLAWIPDGRGWLVHDKHVLLRASKSVVWTIQYQSVAPARFLAQNQLLLAWNGGLGVQDIAVIAPPWEPVEQSLAAIDLHYQVGDPLKLDVTTSVSSTGKDDVKTRLTDTLRGIFSVPTDAQPTAVSLTLRAELLDARDGVRRSTDENPNLAQDSLKLSLQLLAPGDDQPLWQCHYDSSLSRTELKGKSPQAIRELEFQLLLLRLQQFPVPTRIPKSPAVPRLPIISEIQLKL